MRVRHLAGAAAVAVLAAVAVPGALVTPVSAATPGYVGIVIVGSGEHAGYCVRWHSGITGDEILNDVAAVRYRSDGLILTINGQPASGSADNTHYWSYWEDPAGSWQYSSYGPSGTHPSAGTVEGWSYDGGSSSAPSPQASYPAGGLYASMCGHLDVVVGPPATHSYTRPAPAPSTHASVAAAPTVTRATSASSGPTPSPTCSAPHPTPTNTPARTPTTSAPPPPTPTPTATCSHHATPTRTHSVSSSVSAAAVDAQSNSDAPLSPVAGPRHHSRGSAWPTVTAVVLGVALLGGAGAAVWSRRRPV